MSGFFIKWSRLLWPSENNIDRIGDGLANIEGYLENLSPQTIPNPTSGAVNLSKAPAYVLPPSTGSIPTSSTASNASPARIETHDATADTQSAFAGHVIDQAVKQSPIAHRSPALATALFSLKEMLGRTNEHQHGLDVTPKSSIMERVESDNVLPSREEIHDILARAGSMLTSAALSSNPLIPIQVAWRWRSALWAVLNLWKRRLT
jgi:hypothetical protein